MVSGNGGVLFLNICNVRMIRYNKTLTGGILGKKRSCTDVVLYERADRPRIEGTTRVLKIGVSFLGFRCKAISLDGRSGVGLVGLVHRIGPSVVVARSPRRSFRSLSPSHEPTVALLLRSVTLTDESFTLRRAPNLSPRPVPAVCCVAPRRPGAIISVSRI